jgi:polyisoprenoid-binding protein YceI
MSQPAEIPGYTVGRWTIDPVHSDASFTVRHLVSKVRGRFRTIEGTITTAENPLDSAITVSIDPSSIDTGNEQRDAHLRSADFLETDKYPRLTFSSTGIRPDGDDYVVEGDLTIKDVTRSITAKLELGGFTTGPDGAPLAGFTASFEIDRKDYNVNFSAILETGGVVVGDTIAIQLEVEANLNQD